MKSALRECASSIAAHLVPPITFVGSQTTLRHDLSINFPWMQMIETDDPDRDSVLSEGQQPSLIVFDHKPQNFFDLADAMPSSTGYVFCLSESESRFSKKDAKRLEHWTALTLIEPAVDEVKQALELTMTIANAQVLSGVSPLMSVDPSFKGVLKAIGQELVNKKSRCTTVVVPERETGERLVDLFVKPMPNQSKVEIIKNASDIKRRISKDKFYVLLYPDDNFVDQFAERIIDQVSFPSLLIITDSKKVATSANIQIEAGTDFHVIPTLKQRPDDIELYKLLAYTRASHSGAELQMPTINNTEIQSMANNLLPHNFLQHLSAACLEENKTRRRTFSHSAQSFLEKYGYWDLKKVLSELERQTLLCVRERTLTNTGSVNVTGLNLNTLKRRHRGLKGTKSSLRDESIDT